MSFFFFLTSFSRSLVLHLLSARHEQPLKGVTPFGITLMKMQDLGVLEYHHTPESGAHQRQVWVSTCQQCFQQLTTFIKVFIICFFAGVRCPAYLARTVFLSWLAYQERLCVLLSSCFFPQGTHTRLLWLTACDLLCLFSLTLSFLLRPWAPGGAAVSQHCLLFVVCTHKQQRSDSSAKRVSGICCPQLLCLERA